MSGFAAVGLDHAYLSSLGMFMDAFELVRIQVENRFNAHERIRMQSRIHLLSLDGRYVTLAGGRRLNADAGLDSRLHYTLIHVPGFVSGGEARLVTRLTGATRLYEWLHDQYRHGALISASGAAVFVLAEAGLLGGSAVAVARPLIPMFRLRYPGIRIDHRQPFAEHERIFTSAGSAADARMMARLVECTTSPEMARWFNEVTGLHLATQEHLAEDELVANAQLWLENRFSQGVTVTDMARDLGVSQQTLLRRFHRHLGMTPRDYIQKLRIEAAQHLLLRTSRPVQQIAALVGYSDVHAFAKVFRALSGVSANRYRAAKRDAVATADSEP